LQKIVSKSGLNFFLDIVLRFIFLSILATVVAILGKPVFGTTDDNILAGFVDGSYTGERESKLIFIRPLIGSIIDREFFKLWYINQFSIRRSFFPKNVKLLMAISFYPDNYLVYTRSDLYRCFNDNYFS
jgi:hypothetical protein